MTCKCKRELVGYKLGLNYNKSLLFHYCNYCGRIFFYGTNVNGSWLESSKSVNSTLIERHKIRNILKEQYPKEKVSGIRNKTRIELLDKLLKEVEEIKPF